MMPQESIAYRSASPEAIDPASSGYSLVAKESVAFRPVGKAEWGPLPPDVHATHPFRRARTTASAFVVGRIIDAVTQFPLPAVEWLSDGTWRQDRLPSRGEYLIRPGGTEPMRQFRAVLELRAPSLAEVRVEAA